MSKNETTQQFLKFADLGQRDGLSRSETMDLQTHRLKLATAILADDGHGVEDARMELLTLYKGVPIKNGDNMIEAGTAVKNDVDRLVKAKERWDPENLRNTFSR